MKKLYLIAAAALSLAYTGCIKDVTDPVNNVVKAALDLTDFEMDAARVFIKGEATTITIHSSTLGGGTYTVNYSLSGSNNMSNQTASMTMNGTTGTFTTPVLSNGGNTTVTINSISNGNGQTGTPPYGYSSTNFFDSTGAMSCSIDGNSFYATDVIAQLAGSTLSIAGTVWGANLSTVNLTISNYQHTTGTVTFNWNDATGQNGSAGYVGPNVATGYDHGSITITSVSPILQGTFSFTTSSNGQVTNGTFKIKAPL